MISALMEFFNALSDRYRVDHRRTEAFRLALEIFLILLAPTAPHIAEELWQLSGHSGSVHQQNWPEWDRDLARDEIIQLPVQVNGRLRVVIDIDVDALEEFVRVKVMQNEKVQQHTGGKNIVKFIYVPGRVVNIVTSG
jgi:leucyl-tRNA synthetase